jgi:general stress protein 26
MSRPSGSFSTATTFFNTWHTSVKGLALQRDPRVALVVDDEDRPFSFVLVEGVATVS